MSDYTREFSNIGKFPKFSRVVVLMHSYKHFTTFSEKIPVYTYDFKKKRSPFFENVVMTTCKKGTYVVRSKVNAWLKIYQLD